ncbi:phosphoribosylanthranilate isomerase [Erythrobacter litoralis]|uniref:N-(5'-phosphoribosyl)anthranilate isomerase n=1 Tax=Erythrobacter litoralis (strain HTCC2594) TaxID=314225 RepID=TRPF_ERYLH|nr:phosphoribosylanthranilate isomerase [Erythrobacter litoralis]Q2N9N2.1 RecName: Full=N-(5'-phosphoribosyl)anthranilate isomerase; Short=PRAI [Erythrobacter litoralis HTCC2594]ABC63609.1 N-(5'phosphoribosyl)anthranilate isomerase [Erythrobacter litoralis HTCC2594]
MTMIKICGLSTPETIEAAVQAGATHVGLVHFAKSPRHVELEKAAELRALVPESVKAVLLLVNEQPEETARAIQIVKPDVVQFHGSETPQWTKAVRDQLGIEVWKALGVREAATLEKSRRYEGAVDRLLFDSPAKKLPGGNGVTFQWDVLAGFEHHTAWGLAGGLTPDNVGDAIRQTGAELVDASSGVESAPGVKDIAKIEAFCEAARNA